MLTKLLKLFENSSPKDSGEDLPRVSVVDHIQRRENPSLLDALVTIKQLKWRKENGQKSN